MFYERDREPAVDRILDQFSQRLKELGAELRLVSFEDV